MAHTALLSKLISISRLAQEVDTDHLDYDAALALRASRRNFLKSSAVAGISAALAVGSKEALALTYKPARIAIIGAGLAGLRCAYELKKAGIYSTIYEANPSRIGGRCHSNRTTFGTNVTENGGELIDSVQTNILNLAKELGLALDDCGGWAAAQGLEELYHVNGHIYTFAQAFADFKLMANQLNQDRAHAQFPQTWDNMSARGIELDNMTVRQYIALYAPGGANSDFAKVLDVAYNIEYGAETDQQGAYGLVCLLGYSNTTTSGNSKFYWFGQSDERYRIQGGNDQLVTKMAATLGSGQIVQGYALSAILKNAGGSYNLTFATPAGNTTVVADHVVMAIPFSILRSNVNFSRAGFDARKVRAITTMPMGNNCKFQLQFNRRVWHDLKNSGDTFTDLGYQASWEPSRAQPTTTAVINNYTGGNTAIAYSNTKDLAALAKTFLAQFEKLIPGVTKEFNGKLILNNWPKNPYTKGAYGYYAPGNIASFLGYEGVRQGDCHFCGEHTSINNQGYLEGAVETGQRCAEEIKSDLKNA
ncbi:MAG: FAD-dependent oxidoreductase [Rhodoferax sp.]|nr:FAD-dependent oxidoreductase [Rhodoferax sp.]